MEPVDYKQIQEVREILMSGIFEDGAHHKNEAMIRALKIIGLDTKLLEDD